MIKGCFKNILEHLGLILGASPRPSEIAKERLKVIVAQERYPSEEGAELIPVYATAAPLRFEQSERHSVLETKLTLPKRAVVQPIKTASSSFFEEDAIVPQQKEIEMAAKKRKKAKSKAKKTKKSKR